VRTERRSVIDIPGDEQKCYIHPWSEFESIVFHQLRTARIWKEGDISVSSLALRRNRHPNRAVTDQSSAGAGRWTSVSFPYCEGCAGRESPALIRSS